MSEEAKQERIARIIYDMLEGPINNQDYGRQQRQWILSLEIAAAVMVVMEEPDAR